jgi:hypothetical protein
MIESMPIYSPTYSTPSIRLWAVLALLFVLGAQLTEAAHVHANGDPVTSCVQCHSSTGAAILTSTPGICIVAAAILLFFPRIASRPILVATAFLARGPPRNT